MSEYFVEDNESVPIAVTVKLFERHLARWAAWFLACELRIRKKIGWRARPLYAARWNLHVTWNKRDEMPAQALSLWAPHLEQLDDLGFNVCGWIKSDTIGVKEEAYVFLLNNAGNTMATLLWTCILTTQKVLLSFTSYQMDGTEILTIGVPNEQRSLLKSLCPDYVEVLAESKRMSDESLYRLHCSRPELAAAMRFMPEGIRLHYQQQRIRFFEHSLRQGFIRQLSARDVERLRRR